MYICIFLYHDFTTKNQDKCANGATNRKFLQISKVQAVAPGLKSGPKAWARGRDILRTYKVSVL